MRILFWAVVLVLAFESSAWAITTSTVSFQNGINSYTGTFDRRIEQRDGTNDVDGSTVQNFFVDGYLADGTSFDTQDLIRFDNIIGSGTGQVPVGAFILGAQLQLTTSQVGSAQTNGPWGAARLLQPF